MAKRKPGLQKEVSEIFKGVHVPGRGNSGKQLDYPVQKWPYFSCLESGELHRRPRLVRKVPSAE